MVYQLGTLETWIKAEITPEILYPYSELQLKDVLLKVIGQKEAICSYFRDKAIGKPPSPTNKFIQTHQVDLANLIDTIYSYREVKPSVSTGIQQFYDQVINQLEAIMHFLYQHLWEYFDYEQPITLMKSRQAKGELKERLQQLEPIAQHPTMDKALFHIATRPIREFIEDDGRITYQELKYLNALANELRRLSVVEPHIDLVYEMHLSLWGLNYNFPRYVLHFGYWLDQRLSAIEDRNKRLDKLLTYIHDIEQMKVKQGFIFIPTLEPLSEQLLASISTTYKHLFLLTAKNGHDVVDKIRNKPSRAKIKLSVSVSVVALWIKILMLAGIIVNTNKSDVFRAVADLIETPQSEDVSPDSIKGKFNNTPPVTYGQMRDILLRMMDILKQF